MDQLNVTYLKPRQQGASEARARADSAFWAGAIGVGVNVILAQIADADTLSANIMALPPRKAGHRAVVGQYLGVVQLLATAWPSRSKPALLLALAALQSFAERLTDHEGLQLCGAFAGMNAGGSHSASDAARLIGQVAARLDFPIRAFDAINSDFGSYLGQMAAASSDLEVDTVLVTQRLQADHVHASVLTQQIEAVQARLQETRQRQQHHWPLGQHADLMRQDAAAHNAALDSARRQLEQLRADQAALLAEAAHLQMLLPTLSAYLAGIDRMAAGINAALAGALALQVQLSELNDTVLSAPGSAASAATQLANALPHWRAVSATMRAGMEPQP